MVVVVDLLSLYFAMDFYNIFSLTLTLGLCSIGIGAPLNGTRLQANVQRKLTLQVPRIIYRPLVAVERPNKPLII